VTRYVSYLAAISRRFGRGYALAWWPVWVRVRSCACVAAVVGNGVCGCG
jgi:hypothetical protein